MALFPMFVDLNDARVLVVGSGDPADEKIARLAPFGPVICRAQPQAVTQEMLEEGYALVILAQVGHPDNRRISRLCREARIPVNAVDDPALCTVRFPALITRGPLSVGIATDGQSPVAAGAVRRRMEAALPEQTEELMLWAGDLTARLRRRIPDHGARTRALRKLTELAFRLGRPLTAQEEVQALNSQ